MSGATGLFWTKKAFGELTGLAMLTCHVSPSGLGQLYRPGMIDRASSLTYTQTVDSAQVSGRKSVYEGRLAQLVRAPALQAGGRRFESCTAHHVSAAESIR